MTKRIEIIMAIDAPPGWVKVISAYQYPTGHTIGESERWEREGYVAKQERELNPVGS
jgi:hypothetical protein